MEKVRYMISDASSMVNVESHVLRYWEDELELNIPRNEMGHRYYTQENIKEFQYIKELKEKGYQLKAIKMIVHNGDMEQRLPELTGNEADKPGGVKNHQVYFKNPETLALAEAKQSILDNTDRMAQFTELMTDIVGKAIAANNENLSRTSCKAKAIPFPTRSVFLKPTQSRTVFPICAGTRTMAILVRTLLR